MKRSRVVVTTMIIALILAGCQIDTAPQDMAHFSSNRAAVKDSADYSGNFILYRDDSDTAVGAMLLTAHLTRGEIYGFEFNQDQVPVAIAGLQKMELTPGKYRWEMTPDAGQINWDKTNAVVITVVLFTVIIAATAVTLILAKKNLGL